MNSYVYKFEDVYGNILYIGKTNDMHRRMAQHFGGSGHVNKKCYDATARVYYMSFKSDGDALLVEQYMIGKYDPPYNKLGRSKKRVSLSLQLDEKWVLYKILNTKSISCTKASISDILLVGGLLVGSVIYVVYLVFI